MKTLCKQFRMAAPLALGLLVLSSNAFAVATLSFEVLDAANVSLGVTYCFDGQAPCDLTGPIPDGAIIVSQSLPGGFTFNVTTGLTKPVLGSAATPNMDLNSIDIKSTGGTNTLILGFSDTDFTAAPASLQGLFGGTLTAPAGSTVTAEAYFDTGNDLFGPPAGNPGNGGTFSFAIGPFGPGAFSGTASGPGPLTQPYSLTQYIKLKVTGVSTFSGDFELQAVPEPTSVALLAGVLLTTGVALRRRLRKA
jgi:hypothetical protein